MRVGAKCQVAGWGWTSKEGQESKVMREVELKVQNETICEQVFQHYQRQSMICVGDDSNGSRKATYYVSVVLGCKLGGRLGLNSQLCSQVKVKVHQNDELRVLTEALKLMCSLIWGAFS